MKKAIYLYILFQSMICLAQKKTKTDNGMIIISNHKNFELSPFSNIILNKKITKYSFIMKINRISWSKYHSKRDAEILGIKEYELNTGLVFTKEDDNNFFYYYPISLNFNLDKKIQINTNKKMKLKFYTTIYKTDLTPVVVINCIKLIK